MVAVALFPIRSGLWRQRNAGETERERREGGRERERDLDRRLRGGGEKKSSNALSLFHLDRQCGAIKQTTRIVYSISDFRSIDGGLDINSGLGGGEYGFGCIKKDHVKEKKKTNKKTKEGN
jgi:hypothetical protein